MYEIYTIMSGDTWDSIADKYGTTVGILRQINGIVGDYEVMTGTQIVVPVLRKQPYQYYTVKKGDTLEKIARENGVEYSLVLMLNGLDDGDYIYPNQTIMLPKKGIDVYLTMENDTLDYVLKKKGVTIEELMRENENIYLRPEQVLIFKEK